MRKLSLPLLLATALSGVVLSACSPKFDWRDYRSNDAPYAVLFPGKPATQTRNIDLDGSEVSMTMAAAEVDGITFAVGSALLADAAKAQLALPTMKTALLKNINASVTAEKVAALSSGNGSAAAQQTTLDVEAKGSRNGEPMLLIGRFVAKDKRIYQIIIMGREKHIVRETVDTFLSSFKLN
ncbi:hypothetical protein ACFOLJ_05205 [Rugamonas sp. CCM 8940]|uniref:hypothetical protein n=1 Tax=Rugamonas sp. CCM 8940 TaxID=2765359 RepID=UPI0018F58702|nr:hypothetical protein [Rugamonas sp. CCM 8940]MBJ7314240.1 hypothetical protein [Rugamonas sp. CCM 8940]